MCQTGCTCADNDLVRALILVRQIRCIVPNMIMSEAMLVGAISLLRIRAAVATQSLLIVGPSFAQKLSRFFS